MKRSSFFSRLTGTNDHYDDEYDAGAHIPAPQYADRERTMHIETHEEDWNAEAEPQGELAVDVYQTPEAIVVKAFLAGVQPGAVDISLTREMLTISGSREDERETTEDGYYQRELYWGSFTRTIMLPEEIDVDMAEASEKHGVLVIRLPKVNKSRQTKLKVKSKS